MKAERPDPRRGSFRARPLLDFSLAIAAGWWALAGSTAPTAGGAETTPVQARAPAGHAPGGATWAPVTSAEQGASPDRALAVDAFPYAPGGDDLLPSAEPTPPPANNAGVAHPAAPMYDGSLAQAATSAARHGTEPSLLLWLGRDRAAPGESVSVHITTALARHCRADGLLAGEVAPNATLQVVAGAPGVHRLRVTCSGDNGAVTRELSLRVPLPVHPDSLRNRLLAAAGGVPWVRIGELPESARAALAAGSDDGPIVAADFFQEGRYAIFAASARAHGRGEIRFIAADDNGRWSDRSAELLDPDDDGAICARPTVALSADFNRDGRPDVWLGCSPGSGEFEREPGRPLLFSSQADGRYRRVPVTDALAAAKAEARDFDGDGAVDVLVVGATEGSATQQTLLRGRGDGSFGPAAAMAASSR